MVERVEQVKVDPAPAATGAQVGAPARRGGDTRTAAPGVGARRRRLRGGRLLVLCWHNVEGTDAFASEPGVGTRGITRQFELLARTANVVDLPEAVAALEAGVGLPHRAVAITFDDGYQDNVELAAPILERMSLPATFFLVPEMLSGTVRPWWEDLAWALTGSDAAAVEWQGAELPLAGPAQRRTLERVTADMKRLDERERQWRLQEVIEQVRPGDLGVRPPSPIMGWDGARQLTDMGFTIGAHSSRHSILANESVEAQREDLVAARAALAQGLGQGVDLLAYPNGDLCDFSEATVLAAQEAGYRAAVTTIAGWNDATTDRFRLRRFVMYPEWQRKGFGIVPRHTVRRWLGRERD
jgi:peptidoglycan/xylan/chitin deacetylase (PgdA/CDA1 family)